MEAGRPKIFWAQLTFNSEEERDSEMGLLKFNLTIKVYQGTKDVLCPLCLCPEHRNKDCPKLVSLKAQEKLRNEAEKEARGKRKYKS